MSTHPNPGDKTPESTATTAPQESSNLFVQTMSDASKAPKQDDEKTKSTSPESKEAHPEIQKILGTFSITDSAAPDVKNGTSPEDGKEHVRTSDQPQVDIDHFADAAKPLLNKLEKRFSKDDEDGITKIELEIALQDPAIKGEDAQVLAALYKNFDALQKKCNTDFFSEPSITGELLDNYQSVRTEHKQLRSESKTMEAWAGKNLSKFASDGGPFLKENDVDTALARTDLSKQDHDALTLVKKHFDDLNPMPYIRTVDVSNFTAYSEKLRNDATDDLIWGMENTVRKVAAEGQKAGTSYDLYAGKDPLSAINPNAVRQGGIGDCYYEAVVASLAKTNPEAIRDAITDNHNGTYTVKFKGDDSEITVMAPTEAELGLYNHGSKYGIWAAVMEKAFGQHQNYQSLYKLGDMPQSGADGGGNPEPVIKLILGSESEHLEVKDTSQADMAAKLEDAVKNHKVIAAGINKDPKFLYMVGLNSDVTPDKFYKQHEYSILNFTPDGKGGGMVEVRNPWGGDDDTVDGNIKIPLDKFMKNFSDMAIQQA